MNKLEAKNTLYNDPMYDVVVDSRMLEQHLKEKDQQITELQKQLEEKDEEIKGLNKKLDNLWSIYSLLGVEAFGNDIQEQALKEIVKLQRKNDVKKLKKQLKSQPAEIVKKIMSYYTTPMYARPNAHTEVSVLLHRLDTILKEYGEKDE